LPAPGGRIVEDKAACDGETKGLAVAGEFPALDLAARLMAEADAVVMEQVARMPRHAAPHQIGRK
jgi:hypothetical protein